MVKIATSCPNGQTATQTDAPQSDSGDGGPSPGKQPWMRIMDTACVYAEALSAIQTSKYGQGVVVAHVAQTPQIDVAASP